MGVTLSQAYDDGELLLALESDASVSEMVDSEEEKSTLSTGFMGMVELFIVFVVV